MTYRPNVTCYRRSQLCSTRRHWWTPVSWKRVRSPTLIVSYFTTLTCCHSMIETSTSVQTSLDTSAPTSTSGTTSAFCFVPLVQSVLKDLIAEVSSWVRWSGGGSPTAESRGWALVRVWNRSWNSVTLSHGITESTCSTSCSKLGPTYAVSEIRWFKVRKSSIRTIGIPHSNLTPLLIVTPFRISVWAWYLQKLESSASLSVKEPLR